SGMLSRSIFTTAFLGPLGDPYLSVPFHNCSGNPSAIYLDAPHRATDQVDHPLLSSVSLVRPVLRLLRPLVKLSTVLDENSVISRSVCEPGFIKVHARRMEAWARDGINLFISIYIGTFRSDFIVSGGCIRP